MKNQEKNQWIIQEIVKWKENHLLPEEQCDFLLALYTRGGEIEMPTEKNTWLPIWRKLHFAFMLTFLVSVIFLDYYYDVAWYILVGIVSVIFMINVLIYLNMGENTSQRYRYLFLFMQLLYILQLSISIVEAAGLGSYIHIVIMANGAGWIVFGYVRKLRVFNFAGAVLIAALMVYTFF
ncbi:hypothetical protein [Oceanobacillus timonensis]|uniref:hypothetical protein n=1 Tax=Oceanobacillus timonensis TaxID=1926285 RepID=UPI0009BBB932|nr:hypothetical protein [Oceanobacillus timonensis]